jgi:hypothetical protein
MISLRTRRILRRAIVLSVAVHLLLGAILLWPLVFAPQPRATAEQEAGATPGGESLEPDRELVAKHVEQMERTIGRMTPAEREAYLDRKLRQAESLTNPGAVERMAPLIRGIFSARQRAYAPAEHPPDGPFDHDSGLVYSIKRRRGTDGSQTLYYLMVDEAGRSREVEVPAGTDPTAIRVIERMHGSPLLRQIYEQLVLPAIDARLPDPDEAER